MALLAGVSRPPPQASSRRRGAESRDLARDSARRVGFRRSELVRGRQQHSGLSTSKSKKVTSPHAADDDDVEETDTLLDENELESK